ncbi:hypothetical protein STAS_22516 [Striga asiatica]|uniref:Uncharacterized protein n=1 Tax=Striga asiatica TaxID=4170 RepID=A0A5A7QNS6_STRAF|nr:hypothetical protein STAS_22516 [Striga asiatica]
MKAYEVCATIRIIASRLPPPNPPPRHRPTSLPLRLSGFEVVLLTVYSTETKARNGKPVTICIPDLDCYYKQIFPDAELGVEIESVRERVKDFVIQEHNSTNGGEKLHKFLCQWELLQPVLRILEHCLLGLLNADEVEDATSMAIHRMYARASNDLVPQAILATRSFTLPLEPKRLPHPQLPTTRTVPRWQMRPIRR